MSRRRKGVQREFVAVHIVCRCGFALGKVAKQWMGPDIPRYYAPRPLEFRDLPTPTAESGKVARKCPECGLDFQRQWSKLRALLDDLESRGVASFQLTT